MKNQVTFGHIMAILSVIVIPLIIWGNSIEVRLTPIKINEEDIKELQKDAKSFKIRMQLNHDEVMKQLHVIELQVHDKEDRE